ncbi:MAG: MarR family transcriptional regulator [Algibacter sp.]
MEIEQILKTNVNLPLPKKAIISILHTHANVNSQLNEVLKPFDISSQQFNVLRILRGQKGEPASLEIVQERMISKMSNTTRLIDKLIKKKCVEKSTNKTNKRKIDIVIKEEGLRLLKKVDNLIDSKESDLVSSLTKQETLELIRLLGKLC